MARRLGVSRQPVRDAFYRLSRLGFLTIWPQRATIVAPISESAVLQARFIRTAIELETVQAAARILDAHQIQRLQALVQRQEAAMEAGEKMLFHTLDDEFHRLICEFAGLCIRLDGDQGEQGAHGSGALYEPVLRRAQRLRGSRGDPGGVAGARSERAAEAMRTHLSRIGAIITTIRKERDEYFAKEAS